MFFGVVGEREASKIAVILLLFRAGGTPKSSQMAPFLVHFGGLGVAWSTSDTQSAKRPPPLLAYLHLCRFSVAKKGRENCTKMVIKSGWKIMYFLYCFLVAFQVPTFTKNQYKLDARIHCFR